MKILFTTVVRRAPVEYGGELVQLDWTTKEIVNRVSLVPSNPSITTSDDPNPRGNARGGRGIFVHEGLIFVATYHTVQVFNQQLNEVDRISNNLFVGLHEMYPTSNSFWVTSTSIDAALQVDYSGNVIDSWWPRENAKLQSLLGIEELIIDKNSDNRLAWLTSKPGSQPSHTHLNAVTVHDNQVYVLLNRHGLVFNVTQEKVVIHDESMYGCHNVCFSNHKIFVNDSRGKQVKIFDRNGVQINQIELLNFPEIKAIHDQARSSSTTKKLFVRGITPVGSSRVLIGFSPATIAEIDTESNSLIDLYQYSKEVSVCVHGLCSV